MGKLECYGLTKVYEDHRKALEDVTFSVETNGIFALIGRNGAGKTTLIRILATELQATAGTASINGFDVCVLVCYAFLGPEVFASHDPKRPQLTHFLL